MLKNWRLLLLIGITILIFIIPTILWGELYLVGGDDARLYYLYPWEYLHNFSFQVMSHNTLGGNLGYLPMSYSAPVIGLLYMLKTIVPLVNIQMIAYGFIFSSGFLFFYLFLNEIDSHKSVFTFFVRIISSIVYIFSPYILKTFLQHQLISIFLVTVLPGFMYFFVAGVKRKNMSPVVVSAILYSIFSSTLLSLPWLLPALFTLIPLLIWCGVKYKRYFWKSVLVFGVLTIIFNFYWIVHYLIPVFVKTGEVNFASSLLTDTVRNQNRELIAAVANLNSPIHQMAAYLRTGWEHRQGISVIESLGILYITIIGSAGIILAKVRRELRNNYLIAVSGLLVAMMFITPNFGLWNLRLFQFFNDHVPFFVMFRNMYDKFALAMAFQYAFALYIALRIIEDAKTKYVYRYIAIIAVTILTIVSAVPYIFPVYKDNNYSTRVSGNMNPDFLELTNYIKNIDTTSRLLWLPMTFPGYVYIGDEKHPGHYYTGLSPLQLLSGKSDIAGFYGIQTAADPQLNWKILELLKNRSYEQFGQILKSQNIGYIIVNSELLPPDGLATLELFDFMKLQTPEFRRTILGEKIRDFGTRYSVYAINNKFFAPTVFINNDVTRVPYTYQSGAYEIGPLTISGATELFLMEPYSRLWKIQLINGTNKRTLRLPSDLAYGYGNVWQLDPKDFGTSQVHLRIYFWPNILIRLSIGISAAALIITVVCCVVTVFRKKRYEK